MTNYRLVLLLLLPLFLVSLVSADHTYSNTYNSPAYPTSSSGAGSSSSFGTDSSYRESPGYERFPSSNTQINRQANTADTNYDSTSSGYDYRGPMYEKTSTYSEDLFHDQSAKTGFFRSRTNNLLQHSIRASTTEKYIGSSESMFYNTQNRRASTTSAQDTSSQKTDSGFRFGSARAFDSSEYGRQGSSEYGRQGYTQQYYYRPMYDSNRDYFNWRY